MARMLYISLIAVGVFLTPLCNGCSPNYLELNPALSKYQNGTKCLPITEKWYIVYRNYESDPLFGGKAQCGKFSSLGPEEDGGFAMKLQFKHWSIKVVSTPKPSEGYDVDNTQYFHVVGKKGSMMVYIAYDDCTTCLVFRNPYVSENACTLLQPESGLGNTPMCCRFIFDLLCGTGQKYYTYDKETCSKKHIKWWPWWFRKHIL
ncbi:uncharacterized protein LOC115327030 [Ixodes scapularis]|uniref:uncharacterized protein LOC115327030 n=1 Tax=Ixodes scapularis TaxID=6945 RepID=UPI001A9DC4C4|nr:uncharacterized protein LOC115327030 [Ixodes scapularis]